jgi:NADH-quinone oxidoreductase subunit F
MTADCTREVLEEIVAQTGRDRRSLIAVLQKIQQRWHYLPPEVFHTLPLLVEATPAEISSVATFYRGFRLRPAGKHNIKVCVGTACHVKGADNVYEAFKAVLSVAEGEDTDPHGQFTVSRVACLGCCMLAVAVQIDDTIYGWVEPDTVQDVIDEFLSEAAIPPGAADKADTIVKGEVRLCRCSSCGASGSHKIYRELQTCIERLHLPVRLREVGCTGMAYLAPLIEIALEDGRTYNYAAMEPDAVEPVLLKHFTPLTLKQKLQLKFTRLAETLLSLEASKTVFRHQVADHAAAPDKCCYPGQVRLATEHSGLLEPHNLNAYREHGGFSALTKALAMDRGEIIQTVIESGLRGRGGGGYPTGEKWRQVHAQSAPEKVVICNADEGDPGAFMDRMLLESFPFRVIEGILIAAWAVGAVEGMVYVREEYPLAVKRLKQAVADCQSAGLLGAGILNSPFAFTLRVVEGAGAFVCGEETALIASLEGKRGMPSYRPPFPSASGFEGKPTLINNVETLSLIPWILCKGQEAFRALGTASSKGTKTLALAGKVVRGGLIEVTMGMSIRQIVNEIGGGVPEGRSLKAVQMGGPSGGCVPASLADLPVDYEALQTAGAIMGSGGMVVLDDTDCMVDIARYFLEFTRMESCGKCTCCRVGTVLMLEILERICAGQGRPEDLDALEELGQQMRRGSLCSLGKNAANPVLSTLKHFRDEYEAHLQGHCPAGKCRALIRYEVSDECIGCTKCAQHCAAEAIAFAPYQQAEINQEKCVKCGVCAAICPQQAIKVI